MKAPQRRKLFDWIYARDGGRCVYCGAIARRPGPGVRRTPDLATLDHVVPRSKGGRLECGNLVLACRACNNERGIMDAGRSTPARHGSAGPKRKKPRRGTGGASSLRRRQEGF
jgi:5-methylcytosine-specific restriction endonuclease McrA